MDRAVAYLRSSKDRSDMSIAAQRRALTDLAAQRNLAIVDEYADAVESGKDDDRPQFQRLLKDIKRPGRTWSIVLALDTSRIARRRHLALIFEHECERRRIRIIYRNVPDTDPITGMLLKSILQAMDEWHSLNSKAKGLAGMSENVRNGWRAGGKAPRGFDLEYHATGAIREGSPVLKTKLKPNADIELVRDYLLLRADRIPRATAIKQLDIKWSNSSMVSTEWQALTYAGHTVWNMHAEREGGKSVTGEKRRPRSEWVITRDTHPAHITTEQAEIILAQLKSARHGRRRRDSPLLLSGLVFAPDGTPWHSDGSNCYRLGKGKRIGAKRLEKAVMAALVDELSSDDVVEVIRRGLADLQQLPPPDEAEKIGWRIEQHESKIRSLLDLCTETDNPAPILRQVEEIEAERLRLDEKRQAVIDQMRSAQAVRLITAADVRRLMSALLDGIDIEARDAIGEIIERVELEPETLVARVHCHLNPGAGDRVASRSRSPISPVIRWECKPLKLAA